MLFGLAVLSAVAAARGPAAAPAPPASAAQSDWRPVVTGRLRNGVRFAILPRTGSEPGVGLVMRNEGGFIAERRPGERGLAHLIEHVAFASPTIAAPNDFRHVIRIGLPLTFPAASAGTTSWRETNYFLSTRTTRPADLATLLGLFREMAGDLTFRADAVDEQRADVMREMAGRKPGNDIYGRYIAAVAPGSPNDRIDAQNSDDVPGASIETIRGLYRRLYRPEAMMIVIVGNIDPVQTIALIERHFGGWKPTGTAAARVIPTFRADRIAPISVATFPDGRRSALIGVVMPTPPTPRSHDRQADATLMDLLATRAINTRLAAAHPDRPAGSMGIFIENGDQGHRQILLWDNFSQGGGRPAVAGLVAEACALRTAGLSDIEWARAKRGVVADLERQSAGMAQVANVDLAKDLSHALADGRVLLPPDALFRRARAILPQIDRSTANRWWRGQWRADTEHIRVEATEAIGPGDPIAAIRAAVMVALAGTPCRIRR